MNMHTNISVGHLVGLTVLAYGLYYVASKYRNRKTEYSYPPGPKGVPVFGNLFQLPPVYPGRQLSEWSKQYGKMFTLRLGARNWVFINDLATAQELLDKRGSKYIGRPEFAITQDILSGGNRILLMSNTDRWRNLRKIMHQLLMASNADTYRPFQELESRALVWQLTTAPEAYYQHAARFANSVIFSVVFGRRTSMEDANVKLLFSTIDDFMESQTSPSNGIAEQFPAFVKMLPRPLQWFRPKAEGVFQKTLKVYASFLDDLQRRVEEGEDPQCFARKMTDLAAKYDFSEAQKYFCAGSILEAGSDTTRNQINIMLAAAAKYPDWVRKAQSQLDTVCGHAERLPGFDDWDSLPYIVAAVKESLRWRPNMTAAGTPRALVSDDNFGGYSFEKGTVFSYNNFAISHNEKDFPENEVFKPERFLRDDLQEMLKGHLGFGAGRRVCPGWFVGTRNMYIAFARILYCFDISEKSGAQINEYEIDALAHDHPPFEVTIRPRSSDHIKLIEKECRTAGESI